MKSKNVHENFFPSFQRSLFSVFTRRKECLEWVATWFTTSKKPNFYSPQFVEREYFYNQTKSTHNIYSGKNLSERYLC